MALRTDISTVETNCKIDHSEQIAFHPSGLEEPFNVFRFATVDFLTL